MKFYGYSKCGTCVKAKKYLDAKKKKYEDIDITENPPKKTILQKILKNKDYQLKDLFNKSGIMYREMNMKDKLPKMSEKEAIELLAKNGKLVKRPIVVSGDQVTVGFKEDIFKKVWK